VQEQFEPRAPDMAIHLQGVRPITFEDLSSKAIGNKNYMNHVSRQPRTFYKSLDKLVSLTNQCLPSQMFQTWGTTTTFQEVIQKLNRGRECKLPLDNFSDVAHTFPLLVVRYL
jgi:hypothetical protein